MEALFLGPLSIWRASKPQIVIPMSELVTPASTTRAVKRRIAAEYGVTVEEIDGPSRIHRILIPRLLVYEALRNLGFSYPQIGARVGGHTERPGAKAVRCLRAGGAVPSGTALRRWHARAPADFPGPSAARETGAWNKARAPASSWHQASAPASSSNDL